MLPAGYVYGNYTDQANISHGFVDYNGTYTPINDLLGVGGTAITGVNASGEIVGNYIDGSGIYHGFTDTNGIFATLDDPQAGTRGT